MSIRVSLNLPDSVPAGGPFSLMVFNRELGRVTVHLRLQSEKADGSSQPVDFKVAGEGDARRSHPIVHLVTEASIDVAEWSPPDGDKLVAILSRSPESTGVLASAEAKVDR